MGMSHAEATSAGLPQLRSGPTKAATPASRNSVMRLMASAENGFVSEKMFFAFSKGLLLFL